MFFDNGYEHVDGDGDPDLRFDRVFGGAIKRFDPQVLFDPFEEQLHLPAAPVELSDDRGRKREVVGEEDKAFFRLGIEEADAA